MTDNWAVAHKSWKVRCSSRSNTLEFRIDGTLVYDVYKNILSMTFIRIYYRLGDFLSICLSIMLSLDIFTRWFDDFISIKFLIAVFLPASPFINFGDFCQPPCLLHPPRLLFWPKFARLPIYSALPFYLKLESKQVVH